MTDDESVPEVRRAQAGLARWQKSLAVVAVVVGLLLVVVLASGDHGPRRHGSDTDEASEAAPLTEHGPPPGGH